MAKDAFKSGTPIWKTEKKSSVCGECLKLAIYNKGYTVAQFGGVVHFVAKFNRNFIPFEKSDTRLSASFNSPTQFIGIKAFL
jgi:hypothetical protein